MCVGCKRCAGANIYQVRQQQRQQHSLSLSRVFFVLFSLLMSSSLLLLSLLLDETSHVAARQQLPSTKSRPSALAGNSISNFIPLSLSLPLPLHAQPGCRPSTFCGAAAATRAISIDVDRLQRRLFCQSQSACSSYSLSLSLCLFPYSAWHVCLGKFGVNFLLAYPNQVVAQTGRDFVSICWLIACSCNRYTYRNFLPLPPCSCPCHINCASSSRSLSYDPVQKQLSSSVRVHFAIIDKAATRPHFCHSYACHCPSLYTWLPLGAAAPAVPASFSLSLSPHLSLCTT